MAQHDNPWKTLSVREVYDNPWIRVDEHQVINPSGNPGIYGKVAFKNRACAIIPLDDQVNTWIVGQYRYTLDQYSWELPMGGAPLGADPLEGAKRELKEETGLTAQRWETIATVHISNCITDEIGIVYVAEDLEQGDPEFEETEQLQIRRLPFRDLWQMAVDGKITDALSILGILKLAAIRKL
jgi:8-oxo-dGTP pyrophosphatase MutT (NUDIX family)